MEKLNRFTKCTTPYLPSHLLDALQVVLCTIFDANRKEDGGREGGDGGAEWVGEEKYMGRGMSW